MNDTVKALASRNKLSPKETAQMIRETSFKAKTTWLLHLLGFCRIHARHLNLMHLIYDSRNAFVHYKWKDIDVDDERPLREEKRLERAVSEIGRTIRYLRSLENRYFFKGKKGSLVPAVLRELRQGRHKEFFRGFPKEVRAVLPGGGSW